MTMLIFVMVRSKLNELNNEHITEYSSSNLIDKLFLESLSKNILPTKLNRICFKGEGK